MINIIHILGASGSGTTTLGRAIQQTFGYTHLDTDEYFWVSTDPPYIEKRTPHERQRLLKHDIVKNKKCVISGSLCGKNDGWGDIFIPLFDIVIFIDTPMLKLFSQRLFQRLLNEWLHWLKKDISRLIENS